MESLVIYMDDPAEWCRCFFVGPNGILEDYESTPGEGDFKAKRGSIITSLKWSAMEKRLSGITTQPRKIPNGTRSDSDYLYLVPPSAREDFKQLQDAIQKEGRHIPCKFESVTWLIKKYSPQFDEIREKAELAIRACPEARNICTLRSLLEKLKGKEQDKSLETEEIRLNSLLEKEGEKLFKKGHRVLAEARRRIKLLDDDHVGGFRSFLEKKRGKKKVLLRKLISSLNDFTAKHKIERRLQLCYKPLCRIIFDPSLVPEWKRCSEDGCSYPYQTCGCKNVSPCERCYEWI
jgi:hypothetical protein